MAADLQPEWISCLPSSWSFGVSRDGRVFFVNEEAKSTTWLHPVSGEAVITGHRKTPDLPTGWEEGYTFEGARCFINELRVATVDLCPHVDLAQFLRRMPFLTQPSPISTGLGPALHSWGGEGAVVGSVSCPL
ncbi:pleckstrin homology domain-containing family A member 5-like isoform X18 [Channa argus]|uniref:pleckstrin homology domain-containing family A member 5-like isoform X18 n=1 Tax=Channa argus TaxID=215402 RepID=UPI00352115E4